MQLLITCLVLTGLHAMFVMAEYSIVKTSHAGRAKESSRFSSSLSHIHDQLEDYLLVSQIGKTGTLMGVGIFLGRFLSESNLAQGVPGTDSLVYTPGQVFLMFAVIGLIQLVLGQEIPKHWGVQHSDQCAQALSPFMRFSYILAGPILWVIKNLSASLAHR